jgi:hypothetical protein
LLVNIVCHIYPSGTQKACGLGFAKSSLVWILSCLRVGHLSGIELLTDLHLGPPGAGILMTKKAAALGSHLNILFVIEGCLGTLLHDLRLLHSR